MSSSIPPFGRHRAEQRSERATSRSATQEALRPSNSGELGVTLPLYSTGLQSADHLSSRDLFCPASLSDERTSAGAGFRAGVSIRESLTHDGADRGGAAPALWAAAQATVDLRWAARAVRAWVEARAHIPIREDVAGTDDQGSPAGYKGSKLKRSQQINSIPRVGPCARSILSQRRSSSGWSGSAKHENLSPRPARVKR